MDTTAVFDALNKLVARYPDITTTTVNDVLSACDYDAVRAYDTLCEMVIPVDESATKTDATNGTESSTLVETAVSPVSTDAAICARPKKQTPSGLMSKVTYAVPQEDTVIGRNTGLTLSLESMSLQENCDNSSSGPTPIVPGPPKGAWGTAPMAQHYQIDQLCAKYPWLDRAVADALFEKNHGCLELVELDILEMFPVDEPVAYAVSPTSDLTAPSVPYRSPNQKTPKHLRSLRPNRGSDTITRRTAEEKFRERTVAEIRQVAQGNPEESVRSTSMLRLRQQLWEARTAAMQANALANQTRKPNRISDARKKTDEMQRLSTYLLERIRHSEEYRNGCIDLHGLTKDEAIQLVEWKLDDSKGRRRFRVITGKGNHSQNGQSVLRPALERHLRSRGITFTQCGDGILSVTP